MVCGRASFIRNLNRSRLRRILCLPLSSKASHEHRRSHHAVAALRLRASALLNLLIKLLRVVPSCGVSIES